MKIVLQMLVVVSMLTSCNKNKEQLEIISVKIYSYKENNNSVNTGGLFREIKKKESHGFVLLNDLELQNLKKIILNSSKRNTIPSKLGKKILFGKVILKDSEIFFAITEYFVFDVSNNITYIINEKDRYDFKKFVEYYTQEMN